MPLDNTVCPKSPSRRHSVDHPRGQRVGQCQFCHQSVRRPSLRSPVWRLIRQSPLKTTPSSDVLASRQSEPDAGPVTSASPSDAAALNDAPSVGLGESVQDDDSFGITD